MDLSKEINNLMVKHGFFPSRKKAQNFIMDENLIAKMIKTADLNEKDVVLEIGAGTGFLTRELLKHSKVVAVELDNTLCGLLKEEFEKEIASKKLKLIEGNFLEEKLPKFNKVVSLPPYTISTQLLFRLLEFQFETAVFVFQREFVFKCLSKPGFKEFCPLAVMLDYYFESKIIIEKILPESFFPSPKSFSSLIFLSKKLNVPKIKKENLFKLFLKNVFRYKNKNMSNALQKAFPFIEKELKVSKSEFEKIVFEFKQKNLKVYLLEPAEFVEIFEKIF